MIIIHSKGIQRYTKETLYIDPDYLINFCIQEKFTARTGKE